MDEGTAASKKKDGFDRQEEGQQISRSGARERGNNERAAKTQCREGPNRSSPCRGLDEAVRGLSQRMRKGKQTEGFHCQR